MNGIILDGKVYEAIKRGSRHCSDCDLFSYCNRYTSITCSNLTKDTGERSIFRYSQILTDKINENL